MITPDIKAEEKIAPAQIAVETPESVQDVNWRNFREQRENDRKHREAAEKMAGEERAKAEAMKAAMEALLNKPQPSQPGQYYDAQEESEEQRISKQVDSIIAKREALAREERERQEQHEYPDRLKENYKDFKQVVKPDNLDYLEFHYPEVAEPFKHMPDGYKKWECIYKAVKKFVPNTDAQKDIRKAESNSLKPQGMSNTLTPSGSSSGLSVRLDETRRAENWARMQRTLKGLS